MIQSPSGSTAEAQRSDRKIIYAAAFLRALATGMIGVLLGLYLPRLRFSPAEIGFVVAAGLAGSVVATLLIMLIGNRLGRKASLMLLSIVGVTGGAILVLASNIAVVGVAAFLGMVNGMGRDRGASLVLEQTILPATTPDAERTRAFAWYNVLQDVGHASGSLLAGAPVLLRYFGVGEMASFRSALGVYVFLILATGLLYVGLSSAVEVFEKRPIGRVSPESRKVLWRITSLFAIDGLGGGFIPTSLLSFFFYERFGVGEGVIGALFFCARALNALSHLGAAWLAARIGLVKTMVFTHIPSSFLLATVPFAPNFPVAAGLFLLREGLVEMDVPTRQSYVMAVVRPEERTTASSLTHLVRVGTWAIAPSFAGLFMQGLSLATPLFIGAGMKVSYDLLLYAAFRKRPPPEEKRD